MPRIVCNDFCELANKTTQQLYKVSLHASMTTTSKKKKMKFVGELSQVCSQIVVKCSEWVRMGRPDVLWSVKNCEMDYEVDQSL